MAGAGVYAEPRAVTDLGECYFYHTTDVPGRGVVPGEWDLRAGVDDYLGGVDLRGKRVLEVGTASGFLCFHMEGLGADVVAFDLPEDRPWDVVPFAQYDYRGHQDEAREHVRRIHNAFWLCHAAFGSKARKVHGTVYEVPDEVGPVDVTTFGCVLLHLRDPFAALASALRLTRETVVVTEPVQLRRWPALLLRLSGCAAPVFLPDARTAAPKDTWWALTPRVVRRFLAVLGFEEARVRYHRQRFAGRPHPMFTVVGRRTRPLPPSPPAGEGEK